MLHCQENESDSENSNFHIFFSLWAEDAPILRDELEAPPQSASSPWEYASPDHLLTSSICSKLHNYVGWALTQELDYETREEVML